MNIGTQSIALSGIILFGGGLLPGVEAHAFGQQWRPVPGYVAMPGRPLQQAARMPAFRPPIAYPAPPRHAVPDRLPYRPAMSHPRRSFGAAPYGMPQGGYQGYGYPPPTFYAGGGMPTMGPGPGYPFGHQMAPSWQPGPPLFARQYGWRPAGQPWVVREAPRQPTHHRALALRGMTGFRPSGPSYAATAGGWRPTGYWPGGPAAGPGRQGPGYTADRRGGFTPYPPAAWRSGGLPVAHFGAAPAGPAPGYGAWRPVATAGGDAWRGVAGFRPSDYGRTTPRDRRVASHDDGGLGFTRGQLPGWVTTYGDAADTMSCGWCEGS